MRLGRERPRKRFGPSRSRNSPISASMRLGRERPRKFVRDPYTGAAKAGFNEAGARTPQKGTLIARIRKKSALLQ